MIQIFLALTAFLVAIPSALALPNRFNEVIVSGPISAGTTLSADSRSILDLKSTTKGALFPRMTQSQRDAISSPPTGLLVFNTTTGYLNSYNGSSWDELSPGGATAITALTGDVTATGPGSVAATISNLSRAKIAAGSSAAVIYNDDSTGLLSSEAQLALKRGGTAADLSGTGGSGKVLKQSSLGGAITVGTLAASDIPDLSASQITSGTLAKAQGGTGVDLTTASLELPEISTPSTPSSGFGRIYFKSDNSLYQLNDAGTETKVGAGGGALRAEFRLGTDGSSAIEDTDSNQKVFLFEAGGSQTVYTTIKVPTSYTAGSQIKLKILTYSASTSNTVLFQSVASLIRTGTDAKGATTNQRTSTNSAYTNSGSANKINEVVLDLSDSSGQINSTSISAGDSIEVKISRGADSDTAEVKLKADGSEVTFQ